MKIRRWEDRIINVMVEYDFDVDTFEEAIDELNIIDGTNNYYSISKKLYHYDPNEIEEEVCINEPMWIDDEDYWKAQNEFGNWEEVYSIREQNEKNRG